MPRGRPARPAACPAALHGMIWMTRAFFMLAGRLPVLMFSFMIRTLVSFCSQGGQSRLVKRRHSRASPRLLTRPPEATPAPSPDVSGARDTERTRDTPAGLPQCSGSPQAVPPSQVTARQRPPPRGHPHRKREQRPLKGRPRSGGADPELLLQADLVEARGAALQRLQVPLQGGHVQLGVPVQVVLQQGLVNEGVLHLRRRRWGRGLLSSAGGGVGGPGAASLPREGGLGTKFRIVAIYGDCLRP